ncbi:penicillin-insensitive murein endopeptidase [Hyphomicrobium sp.]|uniref:penicillin-insensitive murein endopeptidase n=1 Tax=Hyphomicrobium sp. TaxID=82 RepID=UPI002FDCBD85
MTAEAAAEHAAGDAIVPPLPKPAQRPAASPPASAVGVPMPKPPPPAAKAAAITPDKPAASSKPAKPALTAKQLFGTVKTAAPLEARAIGWYAKGCLAGGEPIAVNGPGWQVMRLSRNRNWGHPNLVALIERLARETTAAGEWPGLLVGDMSQPRGGPMISGHASHQVGLDADIWLTPMPDRKLTRREREDMSAVSMLRNAGEVDPKVWGEGQVKLIKRAASYPEVERILVHPALKKALCEAAGTDRGWLNKVRPYFGHYYHFHVRIGCPKGSSNCRSQAPVPSGDGCGTELADWLKRVAPKPKPPPTAAKPPVKPAKPAPPKPEITLADLPPDCGAVLTAGGHQPPTKPAAVVDRSKNAAPEKDKTISTAAPAPAKTVPSPTKASTN